MKELKIIRKIVELLTKVDISNISRQTNYVNYRIIYYTIAMQLTDKSTVKIGAELNRTHATVLNALKNFKRDILSDILLNSIYTKAYMLSESNLNDGGITLDELEKMEELIEQNKDLRLEMSLTSLNNVDNINGDEEKELINLFRDLDQDTKERALFLVNNLYKVNQKLSA